MRESQRESTEVDSVTQTETEAGGAESADAGKRAGQTELVNAMWIV